MEASESEEHPLIFSMEEDRNVHPRGGKDPPCSHHHGHPGYDRLPTPIPNRYTFSSEASYHATHSIFIPSNLHYFQKRDDAAVEELAKNMEAAHLAQQPTMEPVREMESRSLDTSTRELRWSGRQDDRPHPSL
jgi:hypothetical protein